MAKLVIMGRQGSGKGTQGARLAERLGIAHLSTGDIFRAAVKAGSPLGLAVSDILEAGGLVPDELTIKVVAEALGAPEMSGGYLLDGFPRTIEQAAALERIAGPGGIDLAINLDVSASVVLDRIAGRRVCDGCGQVRHVSELAGSTCEACGHEFVIRSDDNLDSIHRRLAAFEEQTVPILAWYRVRGKLLEVDGSGSPDEVFARLVAEVANARARWHDHAVGLAGC